jgi:hypothetical protein
MRDIPSTTLAKLAQTQGLEPFNIVEVQWSPNGPKIQYSDRALEGAKIGLLELANLEDVIRLDSAGHSSSLSIKLDDTDGAIKAIIDKFDIHRRPVKVYQSFAGIEGCVPFVLYEGVIETPISWKESDRTLTFNITTKLEDLEIGYSPEQGDILGLPSAAIGKPWPMGFGTCHNVPAVTFQLVPFGQTQFPFGIPDPSLPFRIGQLHDQLASFSGSLQLLFLEAALAHFQGDFQAEQTFENLAVQVQETTAAIFDEITKLTIEAGNQGSFFRTSIPVINGNRFPQNRGLVCRIGDSKFSCYFSGNNCAFALIDETWLAPIGYNPDGSINEEEFKTAFGSGGTRWVPPSKVGFRFYNAGSAVKVISPLSQRWIANIIPSTIIRVQAFRSVNNLKQLAVIPNDLWTTSVVDYHSFQCQVIDLVQPLSTIEVADPNNIGHTISEGWEDQIYVTFQSTVGPNTVDVIRHLVETYSNLTCDDESFAIAHDFVAPYPSDFCITERPPLVSAVQDIAYQARMAAWIKDDKFFLKYLPAEVEPVTTITENDVDTGTLEMETTTTEDIITKMTASYIWDYSREANEIIVRYHIQRYGLHAQSHNYFIYTDPAYVLKSVTYWMIRFGNTWKKAKFKTMLNKLQVETFDTISLDFAEEYFAKGGQCLGIVESASYDSSDNTIEFMVWLPIRLGEMEPAPFAFPHDLDVRFEFPDFFLEYDSNPLATNPNLTKGFVPTMLGGGQSVFVEQAGEQTRDTGERFPSDQATIVPLARVQPDGTIQKIATPVSSYSYRDFTNPPDTDTATGSTFPGLVESSSSTDNKLIYSVKAYPNGLLEDSVTLTIVKQLALNADDVIPPNTPVMVSKVKGKEGFEYYMLVPIWLG